MNRLWVRLSLAFTGVVVISFFIITLIIGLTVRTLAPEFERANHKAITDAIQTVLIADYEETGSWAHAELILDSLSRVIFGLFPVSIQFELVDAQAEVIYAATLPDTFEQVSTVLLRLDGQPIGQLRLFVDSATSFPNVPLVQSLLLLIAFVGGVIGVLFGILMSRMLTSPLDDLVKAAEAIGAKDWQRRVTVSGTIETQNLAAAFNNMAATLEVNEKLRRNMVADVAHELRTPLVAFQGNLYAILDDVYPLTKPEIANLYDQSRLLSRLVDDLHELAQADANQLQFDRNVIDLGNTVQQAVAAFNPMASVKGVDLVASVPDAALPVLADSARMTQVVQSLLNNALTYTPADGKVTITGTLADESVCVQITDTGPGIEPEHLPYIFERFYRTDAARSRHTGGTGLGLAIVRAIVEAHNGTVQVVSPVKDEYGTSFTICLPIAAPLSNSVTNNKVLTDVQEPGPSESIISG